MIDHCNQNLDEILMVIDPLSDGKYSDELEVLSGASIGQHVRHILEFYICLLNGLTSGVVNYDLRKRDLNIETSVSSAIKAIEDIKNQLPNIDLKINLLLEGDMSNTGVKPFSMQTTVKRELAYNLEHSIHHQAIIKIGLRSMQYEPVGLESFGVAPSTLRSN